MILADKIINERKKKGWSQEELAVQLNVSRQSVSKWEGAQAAPDLNKILKMSEIFGVSTDYLLKDEIEPKEVLIKAETGEEKAQVSLEEASAYLDCVEHHAHSRANAISMCITCPAPLIFLAGLSEDGIMGISENQGVMAGMVCMFILIAAAVYIFVTTGHELEPYEYMKKDAFETGYGVTGMVSQRKMAFDQEYSSKLAQGIVLCILSALSLIVMSLITTKEYLIVAMASVLLIVVAAGVNLIVSVCTIRESYQVLLKEGEYTENHKETVKKTESISKIFWSFVTALYLLSSLLTGRWGITWIIWPAAGVLSNVVEELIKSIVKSR